MERGEISKEKDEGKKIRPVNLSVFTKHKPLVSHLVLLLQSVCHDNAYGIRLLVNMKMTCLIFFFFFVRFLAA